MHKSLLALALCLAVAPATLAQEIVYGEALAPVTLRELAGVSYPPPPPREVEHESRRSRPVEVWRAQPTAVWEATPTATIARPAISTSFASIGSGELAPGDASGAVRTQRAR